MGIGTKITDEPPGRRSRRRVRGLALAVVAAVSVIGNVDPRDPPRYDGAGYALLAQALLQGNGYRAVEHPDQPPHAHLPPGYPLMLAALWRIAGVSVTIAHLASAVCTVAAVLVAWRWIRRVVPPRAAFLVAMALAVNWTWGRIGGAIRSEPPYLLLSMLTVAMTGWGCPEISDHRHPPTPSWVVRKSGPFVRVVVLGFLLGGCVLTRHVGGCLVAAVGFDLVLRGRWRTALAVAGIAALLVTPWILWMASVGEGTQAELLPGARWVETLMANAVFYLRRIPDQIVGPVVEIATVFRPGWSGPATWLAAVTSGVVLGGWLSLASRPRSRLTGLVPLLTLALLLVWPFTEAGRFLVPLVPFLLLGAVEGLAGALRWLGLRRATTRAAWLVLLASIPYPAYALLTRRAAVERATHADFDAACAWLAAAADRPGPVLSRHPGEVYWQAGRLGMAPTSAVPEAIDALIDRYQIAYLLVDEDRYVRAPSSVLGRYADQRGLRAGWVSESGSVRVYPVFRRDPPEVR